MQQYEQENKLVLNLWLKCKESAYNVGDLGSVPRLGRSPGEGNDNPLQYSCLENPMDGGAWEAAVSGIAKSWTRLSDFTSLHHVVHSPVNILSLARAGSNAP